MFNDFVKAAFSPTFLDNLETTLNERIHPKLKNIENFIGDREFVTGTLTVADFFFFEALNLI